MRAIRDFFKCFMLAGLAEPVFGVGIVGFAAVHEGVEVGAVGGFDGLGNGMGGVEVVVPEEDGGADEVGGRRIDAAAFKGLIDLELAFFEGPGIFAAFGPKAGRGGGGDELGDGVGDHWVCLRTWWR